MGLASISIYVMLGLALLGILLLCGDELVSRQRRISGDYYIKNETTKVMLTTTRTSNSPWFDVAPRIHTDSLPPWLTEYIDWHNSHHHADDNATYMIYTCRQGNHCSGTGNRQRGIMATFLVAIITKRVFLMDIDNPVPLDEILQPHLIQWKYNNTPLGLRSFPLYDIRNVQPNPLQRPQDFMMRNGDNTSAPAVIRILANGPGGLNVIWASPAMQSLLDGGDNSDGMPREIYKWLFYTLFQPTVTLSELVRSQRQQLGLFHLNSPYIGIHVRLGGGGAWTGTREERYHVSALPHFLELAQGLQQTLLQQSDPSIIPMIVISDDERAKQVLHDMESSIRFVSNTTLVHVDRSVNASMLQGSLQVWADILLLAQSTCLVESLSSFSSLARRISISSNERCFVRQDQDMLLQDKWKPYWANTSNDSTMDPMK